MFVSKDASFAVKPVYMQISTSFLSDKLMSTLFMTTNDVYSNDMCFVTSRPTSASISASISTYFGLKRSNRRDSKTSIEASSRYSFNSFLGMGAWRPQEVPGSKMIFSVIALSMNGAISFQKVKANDGTG